MLARVFLEEIVETFESGNTSKKLKIRIAPVHTTESIRLTDYYEVLECRLIDIIEISDDVVIVCDSEGLMKQNNPVYEVMTTWGEKVNVAGNFLIAYNKLTNEGWDTRGFKNQEHLTELVMRDLNNIRLVGMTK